MSFSTYKILANHMCPDWISVIWSQSVIASQNSFGEGGQKSSWESLWSGQVPAALTSRRLDDHF